MRRRTTPDIGDLVAPRDALPWRAWVGYITEKHGIHVVIQLFSGRSFMTRRDSVYVLSSGGK